jgi:exosortase A-associated hydrolase 2
MHFEFIHLAARQLFCCWSSNEQQSDTLTLILPPFGDEMNKCRHLFTQLRQQLFLLKQDLLVLDPYGTGDSAGDLSDTTLQIWTSDYLALLALARQRGYQRVNLVAVRFGYVQLLDLMQHELPLTLNKLLLWQPLQVPTFLQQLFRLKIAEQMSVGQKVSQKQLEGEIIAGATLEIAGYPISAPLLQSIQQAPVELASQLNAPLLWLETNPMPQCGPLVQQQLKNLQQKNQAQFIHLQADPYWNSAELVQAPELLAASCHFLQESH